MDVIQSVVELVRENSELRKKAKTFDEQMESLVGARVSLQINHGRKRKFHHCVVDAWNGESWELLEETTAGDDDDPEFFEASFEDFVQGTMWVNPK